MARQLSIEFAEAFFHVTSRAYCREAIYETDADRVMFMVFQVTLYDGERDSRES